MHVIHRSLKVALLTLGLVAGLGLVVGCQTQRTTSGVASTSSASSKHVGLDEWAPSPVAFDPKAVCFAEGTPEYVQWEVSNRAHREIGPLAYYLGSRWSGAPNGTPKALTWSLVPDGTWIDSDDSWDNGGSGANSVLFAEMDAQFGGNRAQWIGIIQDCFDRWEELTGVSYTRITYGGEDWDDGASWGSVGGSNRGDVRIAMRNIDGTNGVLAYNFFPDNGDMLLDESEYFASASYTYRFMRNIVMHEHGHGLGLEHVCPSNGTKLMEPYINSGFTGPRHDDIRAIHEFYGDVYESDNNWVNATHIGALTQASPIILGPTPSPTVPSSSILSIDANAESDYFRFTVDGPRHLDATVIPVGLTYDSSEQQWDGTCLSGNNIDSSSVADLEMAVYDTNGSTILASATSSGVGEPESLNDVVLDEAGDYFLRIYEGNYPTDSQMYRIVLSVTEVECGIDEDCDDGAFCNGPETCDAALTCQPGTPPVLDDGVDCTVDSCDEATDTILHEPLDAYCDDGNECTSNACHVFLGCQTSDANEGEACDAGEGPGSGTCMSGTCVPTTLPCTTSVDCVVANNSACEWDYCNPDTLRCEAVLPMMYGDVCGTDFSEPPNSAVNLTDILCTLDAFGPSNLVNCPNADVAGTPSPPEGCPTGNGVVNLTDVVKVLDAFGAPTSPEATFACECPWNPW